MLEKNEQRQIKIFQLLLERSELSVNEILVKLSVDRATFKEDIVLLEQHLKAFDELSFTQQEGKIALRRLGNLSTSDVYYSYLKESIKYQILMYLLENGSFERQKFLTQLNISSATLTRRIKELNLLLVEFHLQIKNGHLYGSEIQIRYFYFQLLWFGRPYLVNLKEFSEAAAEGFLVLMKNEFSFPFTEDGEIKFQIWLYIMKKRLRASKKSMPDYSELPSELLQTSGFLLSLQKFLSRYFFQSAFGWNQNETLIFYLFMICNFTLDTHNDYVRKFLIQEKHKDKLVDKLNETFKETLQEHFSFYSFSEDFSEKIALTVMQNHFRLVYFRGWISVFGHQGLQQRLSEIEEKQLLALCQSLTQQSLGILDISESDKKNSQFELFGRYASILQLIFKEVELRLQVACDFPYERVMADIVIEMIRERMPQAVKLDLVNYQKNQQYDVILTSQVKDYPLQKNARIFVMLSNEYDFDFPYLGEFLKECYLQKINSRMKS